MTPVLNLQEVFSPCEVSVALGLCGFCHGYADGGLREVFSGCLLRVCDCMRELSDGLRGALSE